MPDDKYTPVLQSVLHELIETAGEGAMHVAAIPLVHQALRELDDRRRKDGPIPMRLPCPECGELHIDVALANKPHHTHACQHCGMVWRPARVDTVGVKFLPGYKDEPDPRPAGGIQLDAAERATLTKVRNYFRDNTGWFDWDDNAKRVLDKLLTP